MRTWAPRATPALGGSVGGEARCAQRERGRCGTQGAERSKAPSVGAGRMPRAWDPLARRSEAPGSVRLGQVALESLTN